MQRMKLVISLLCFVQGLRLWMQSLSLAFWVLSVSPPLLCYQNSPAVAESKRPFNDWSFASDLNFCFVLQYLQTTGLSNLINVFCFVSQCM